MMPFAYDSFLYDYTNFDSIKQTLDRNSFFNILDKHLGFGKGYFDDEDYYHAPYMDQYDFDGIAYGDDFDYVLNKDLFRDKHFTSLEKENYNILTLGCSYTFGYGLPEQYAWPRILETKISNYCNAKVFNLSSPGLSIDSIINNTVSFIDKYGAPDAIFALFPDMNRYVTYHSGWKEYTVHTPNIGDLKNKKNDRFFFNQTKNYVFENRIYSAVNNIRALEQLCKAYNIKLIWHSWPGIDVRLYSELNFDNYVEFDKIDDPEQFCSLLPDNHKQYIDAARDNCHPGIKYNFMVSSLFINNWKEENGQLF